MRNECVAKKTTRVMYLKGSQKCYHLYRRQHLHEPLCRLIKTRQRLSHGNEDSCVTVIDKSDYQPQIQAIIDDGSEEGDKWKESYENS